MSMTNHFPPTRPVACVTAAGAFAIFAAQALAGAPCEPTWDTAIGSPGLSSQGLVTALHTYNGTLIVGGFFAMVGDVPANFIAQWDGANWHPMGNGTNDIISCMADFDGKLAVAGDFTSAGEVLANHVALWDGKTWSALGEGFDVAPVGLAVYQGQLVAAGDFTMSGSTPVGKIARWDGKTWQSMGGQIENGSVAGLAVHDGELVVSGGFNILDGVDVGKIARWDGAQWQPMDTGLQGFLVKALISHNGQLVAGGMFHSANKVAVNSVARWDGTQWQPFGTGITYAPAALDMGFVNALCSYNGQLIAGGTFDTAGGVAVQNIARWDGSAWHPMGNTCDLGVPSGCGIDHFAEVPISVWGLATVGDTVYVGGAFEHAYGLPAGQIIGWSCAAGDCAGDVSGDSIVNVDDLIAVILGWGPCPAKGACADTNNDDAVDVDDLIAVILNWGECP